jgi:D-alanyl-D-alanine carboxypeptidase
MRRRRFLLTIALLCATTLQPTRMQAQTPEIKTTIQDYARAHNFDGTILIQQRGKRIYQKSFGIADRAFNIPIKNDTRFKVASITKAFTAVLILQLCEQGKIALDQPIKTYLPDYTGEGADKIKVHHLLNHTSGIPNIDQGLTSYDESRRRGIDHYQKVYTPDELIRKFCRGKLVREPGKAFDYNNADYMLLGKILEKITGKPYEQVLREQILLPLGMRDSGLLHQHDIVAKLSPTYFRRDGTTILENEMPAYIENWYAAGAMYSTAPDLLRFANALFGGRLLKPESLDRMLTPGLDDYGYGVWIPTWEVGNGKKIRVVFRPGGIMGANSMLVHNLDDDTTIILLSNTNRTKLDDFVFQIARVLSR